MARPLGRPRSSWAPRCLVLQHEADTPPGLIADWLEEQTAQVETVRIDEVQPNVDPRDYDLVVVLGSEHAAYDDSLPFLAPEMRLLSAAHEADVPTLGVCFGGQLLARVLGARVFRIAAGPEIGWLKVRTHHPELLGEGPWLQWHYDGFSLPPGSQLIAETDVGVQAFVAGRTMGLQCHPEVTPEIVAGWARLSSQELAKDGVDPQALVDQTSKRERESKVAAWRLLDRFRDRVVGEQGVAARDKRH
jgi:GMP synthase-like glutamine amidotransferase